MGADSIDTRIVIGHVYAIHPWIWSFYWKSRFRSEPFVTIRKRLSNKAFDSMNQVINYGTLGIEIQNNDNEPFDELDAKQESCADMANEDLQTVKRTS